VASTYNPADKGEHSLAPKIWELLRHNPTFWRYVKVFQDPSKGDERNLHELTSPENVLAELDHANPIAAYALRWCFDPIFLKSADVPQLLGLDVNARPMTPAAEMVETKERQEIISLFPYLGDDAVSEVICEGWDKFIETVPFYAMRRHKIFESENLQKVFGSTPKFGPIIDERDREKYKGQLKISSGDFTLDTPWPDTPEIFRNHFSWLWCHFDFTAKSPFTDDRRFLPGPQDASWLVDQIATQPRFGHRQESARAQQIRYFYENCTVFAFPNLLYTKPDMLGALENLKFRIQSAISFSKRIVGKTKFNSLIGSRAEWDVFYFCRPKINYAGHDIFSTSDVSHSKPVRAEITEAVSAWRQRDLSIRRQKTGGQLRLKKDQTHLTKRYRKMEAMMFSVFPQMDVAALVKHSTF